MFYLLRLTDVRVLIANMEVKVFYSLHESAVDYYLIKPL